MEVALPEDDTIHILDENGHAVLSITWLRFQGRRVQTVITLRPGLSTEMTPPIVYWMGDKPTIIKGG
jgi:hypothetical protein